MSDTDNAAETSCNKLDYSKEDNAEKKQSWNPPELECWQKAIFWFSVFAVIGIPVALAIAAFFCPEWLQGVCIETGRSLGTFILVSGVTLAFPMGIIAILWVRYRIVIHVEQVQDRSTVESLLEQACTAACLLESTESEKDQGIEKAKYADAIRTEVQRLRQVGPDGWTYNQTLHLGLLLVDALDSEEEARAEAELALTQLADYVEDSSAPFDMRQYNKWDERLKIITNPKSSVEYWRLKHCSESTEDHKSRLLELGKYRLKALKDYITDIESDWATGSVILRNLKYSSIATILAFLLVAFFPVIATWCTSSGNPEFGWFEWGLLGSVGALLSVLHKQQKYDIVELGNTEGQIEFWRAFAGGCLGLVAGLIAYALIRAGVVSGRLFPSFCEGVVQECGEDSSLYLSLIWAIGAGFGFEKIFDRVKQTWGGDSGSYKPTT